MRMQSLRCAAPGALALAVLLLAIAAPAGADSIYRWVTEDGVVAFTDTAERVPPRYRDVVRREPRRALADHERFTPTDPEATAAYASRLGERVARLRALNATLSPAEAPGVPATERAPAQRTALTLETGQDARVELDVDTTNGPVIVEERRVLDREAGLTRRVTLVRQGDRILSIVKNPAPYRGRWDDFSSIEELEQGRY